jgi:hypothetical protein
MDAKRFPTLAKVLAASPNLPAPAENLLPADQREMIARLYEELGAKVFGFPEDHTKWIGQMVRTQMTDNEIKHEWDFIQKGNVHKLVDMFQKMGQPGAAERHPDRMKEMEDLHRDISEGLMKYREAGKEIEPEAFEMVDKTLMNFVDKFLGELDDQLPAPAAKPALPGPKKRLPKSPKKK